MTLLSEGWNHQDFVKNFPAYLCCVVDYLMQLLEIKINLMLLWHRDQTLFLPCMSMPDVDSPLDRIPYMTRQTVALSLVISSVCYLASDIMTKGRQDALYSTLTSSSSTISTMLSHC